MCKFCDEMAAKGITSDALVADAKQAIKDLMSVDIEVLVCDTLNRSNGKTETMHLVQKDVATDLAERLHAVGERTIYLLTEVDHSKKALDLMHSSLVKMAQVVKASGNADLIAATSAIHEQYKVKMEAIQESRAAAIAADGVGPDEDEDLSQDELAEVFVAQAEDLLKDPNVPAGLKSLISKIKGMVEGNDTVH